MFRGLSRYESYSAAGDWIAEVPDQWSWEPARTIFVERKAIGFTGEPLLSVTIGRGVIPQADLIASTSKKDSSNIDKSKYKLVKPGDVVYNKMRAWQGAAGSSQHRGIVSPAYIVMTPRAALPDYVHHLVRTPMFAKEAERWSYGITSDQWSLRPEHFKMIRFPLPPLEDQAAIVKYLTHANARIDKAIAAKRRLIALLGEQEAAKISSVFDSVEKDSVPLEPLKRLADIKGGMTPSKEKPAFWGGTIPWVSPKDMKADLILDSIDHITEGALNETSISLVRRGALVLVVRGMILARTVPVAVLGVDATLNQDMKALIPRAEVLDVTYLRDWFRAHDAQVRQLVETAGHGTKKLETNALLNLRVRVPNVVEQAEIVAQVEAEVASTRFAIKRLLDEIKLLQEFRTRLVADVVTGQVDVRAIAATLPDPPEMVDELSADDVDAADEVLDWL